MLKAKKKMKEKGRNNKMRKNRREEEYIKGGNKEREDEENDRRTLHSIFGIEPRHSMTFHTAPTQVSALTTFHTIKLILCDRVCC
jgi:hypothetical protein